MAPRNDVELIGIRKQPNGKFDISLKIGDIKRNFAVRIVDNDGIFAVDMPDELGILLREFPMSHKKVVTSVRTAYQNLLTDRHLRAA